MLVSPSTPLVSCYSLKECSSEQTSVLVRKCKQSLRLDGIPSDSRNVYVASGLKGDRDLLKNYHPVSLKTVCCKFMEHITCPYINSHGYFMLLSTLLS